jgi:transcriptional regulator with XRE-family HTH domain
LEKRKAGAGWRARPLKSNEEMVMIIGERLKAIRESKNLSQGHIEKRTGLLRCYVSRCENGHTVPSIDTLNKWAGALEISMSELFAEDGKAAKPLPAIKNENRKLNRATTNSLHRIEAAFAKMKPRDVQIVTGLVLKFAAAR